MTTDDKPFELPLTFVRHRHEGAWPQRRFGPKTPEHSGCVCLVCNKPLAAGDYSTLIPLGPGDDPEVQEKARAGRYYPAVALEVHWACATGGLEP